VGVAPIFGEKTAAYLPPELAALYTQACEKRVEAMENELLEIADDTDRDYREGKNGREIPNKEVVLRSKVRIEARQWLMSRRDPKQWGDKSSVDVSANIMLRRRVRVPGATGVEDGSRSGNRRGAQCNVKNAVGRVRWIDHPPQSERLCGFHGIISSAPILRSTPTRSSCLELAHRCHADATGERALDLMGPVLSRRDRSRHLIGAPDRQGTFSAAPTPLRAKLDPRFLTFPLSRYRIVSREAGMVKLRCILAESHSAGSRRPQDIVTLTT
jgi:hypothetical protein